MSWIETLWGLTYDGKIVTWERFTKRTDDPKLGWLERRLADADIPFRRNGSSAHAPILEVDEDCLDDAWEILSPVDDVDDDDPQFLELEMPKKPDKKVKKARKPKQQHPCVSDAAMLNLTTLIREASGVVNDPTIEVNVYLWLKEPRVAEVSFSGPVEGGGWGGSSFMQNEPDHAPLILACERYLWAWDNDQNELQYEEWKILTFFADDDETPVQRYTSTYVDLLHRVNELRRSGYDVERLDKATEELRQILVKLEAQKPDKPKDEECSVCHKTILAKHPGMHCPHCGSDITSRYMAKAAANDLKRKLTSVEAVKAHLDSIVPGHGIETAGKTLVEVREALLARGGETWETVAGLIYAPSTREFYRSTVSIEVLSEEPLGEVDLGDINHMVTDGDCSGSSLAIHTNKVSGPVMAKLLEAQGSDAGFFQLTPEGEDAE